MSAANNTGSRPSSARWMRYELAAAAITADNAELFRRQRDELAASLTLLLELQHVPDRNCSCHISPPCNDCVEWSYLREAMASARDALSALGGQS